MKNEARSASVSAELYDAIHKAFDFFNTKLFDDRLPPVVITLHRKKNADGYFWAERWALRGEKGAGLHEIALNPETMGRDPKVVLSTLAHETVHHEQECFGKPSKGGHHNKEWGEMMDRIGLTPTDTGREGGKRTGRKVTHMIVQGGDFDKACDEFLADHPKAVGLFSIPPVPVERKKDLSKVKHTCPSCATNVWGKVGIRVMCDPCGEMMEPADTGEDK